MEWSTGNVHRNQDISQEWIELIPILVEIPTVAKTSGFKFSFKFMLSNFVQNLRFQLKSS